MPHSNSSHVWIGSVWPGSKRSRSHPATEFGSGNHNKKTQLVESFGEKDVRPPCVCAALSPPPRELSAFFGVPGLGIDRGTRQLEGGPFFASVSAIPTTGGRGEQQIPLFLVHRSGDRTSEKKPLRHADINCWKQGRRVLLIGPEASGLIVWVGLWESHE